MSVLFIQNRPSRAGAQTSLARLVTSAPMRTLNPVVLLGGHGWLEDALLAQKAPVITLDFPSPRSLTTRLLGMGSFAKQVLKQLDRQSIKPAAIIANDHQECPLALALSKAMGAVPTLGILRSSGMTWGDFEKYQCDRCGALMAVGAALHERSREWSSRRIELFQEGFAEADFLPPKPWPPMFPDRVLVIGTEAPGKGFADFIEAVDRLETEMPAFPGIQCDFTGRPPAGQDALLARPRRSSFEFLGRVENFSQFARQYGFAVHPSRAETFGLAAIESLLAGTPTLISLTGVAGSLPLPQAWTFPPADVEALTNRLADLWRHWRDVQFDLARVAAEIRRSFHIDRTASFVNETLKTLGVS